MYTFWSADADGFRFSASDVSLAENARRLFIEYLGETCEPDSDLTSAELVFGELLGNVVKHAPGAVTVLAQNDHGRVRLEIGDEGPGYRIDASAPDVMVEHHRGLFIVNALAEELQTFRRGAEQVTSCVLPVRCRVEPLRLANPFASRVVTVAQSQRIETQTNVLLAALELHHPEIVQHMEDVAVLAERVAHAMGLPPDVVTRTRDAARLHDVGLNAVPRAVLRRAGELSVDERIAVERHPMLAAAVVAASPVLEHLAPIVRAHHERFDGAGYPNALVGEEIPLEARIIAVADVFLTLTVRQPYREMTSPLGALAEIAAHGGKQFDPVVVAALRTLLRARAEHSELA